jgi:type IV secretory pathway VirB2 component (pilin)
LRIGNNPPDRSGTEVENMMRNKLGPVATTVLIAAILLLAAGLIAAFVGFSRGAGR